MEVGRWHPGITRGESIVALHKVEIKHDSGRAVLVRVIRFNLTTWIPRSIVSFPAVVVPKEILGIEIPGWFMKRELGITKSGGGL